jgi:uncharacterized protein (DUF1800 family)
MARCDERHSQEQRDAVIAAQLEGMGAEEAVARAATGELGLEPFEMGASTARDLAAEARRAGAPTGLSPVDQAEAEERAYLEAQVARIRAIEEPTPKQVSTMREAMRALEDIKRRAAKRAIHRPPKPAEDGELSPLGQADARRPRGAAAGRGGG